MQGTRRLRPAAGSKIRVRRATRRFSRRKEPVYTVGYAGRTVDGLVSELAASGVRRLIDVRALPLSRRRGFSKTALAAALGSAGIEYVHVREAGNPFRHEASNIERCLALYRGYLDERPEIVERLAKIVSEVRSALLCVESDPLCCHRSVIASLLAKPRRPFTVTNL